MKPSKPFVQGDHLLTLALIAEMSASRASALYLGGIKDSAIAYAFDAAAAIRLLIYRSEIRQREFAGLANAITASQFNPASVAFQADQTPAPPDAAISHAVFQSDDPRLANPFDPSLPANRTVIWGAPKTAPAG